MSTSIRNLGAVAMLVVLHAIWDVQVFDFSPAHRDAIFFTFDIALLTSK
jgi:hypothetical protein